MGDYYAAASRSICPTGWTVSFGPAYRASRWRWPAASSLYRNYGRDLPYCYQNRKEAKDHGEGGSMVGYKPQDGDRVVIVEDVVTSRHRRAGVPGRSFRLWAT